jgi:hypothetical protein
MLMSLEDRANAKPLDRTLRLVACASLRRVWYLLVDPRSRVAVEVAERYADGLAGPEELDAAGYEASAAASDLYVSGGLAVADETRLRGEPDGRPAGAVFGERAEERVWIAARAAEKTTAGKVGIAGTGEWYEGGAWVAALTATMSASDANAGAAELRAREAGYEAAVADDGATLPTRDAVAGAAELRARKAGIDAALEARRLYEDPWQADILRCIFSNPFRPAVFDPSWLDIASVALGRSIYDRRGFDRLPELADALEEAGWRDPGVLDHCRQPGEHARGCWDVDALLGKE